jgi:hypothetical protein
MIVWVLSSLLIGLSTWRMTRSIILGVATQLTAFEALFSLVPEPMHPGGILVLLLSAIMTFSCFVRDRTSPLPMALLGGAMMALIFVKINIGIFALAALALVCVVSYPALARHSWLRIVIEVGFVALPLLVMSSKVGEPWVRHFAFHISAAALAVVIALRARRVDRRDSKELWWLGGGALVVGLIVPLVLVAAGTSPSRLIDGIIMLPLRFPSLLTHPLVLPSWSYVLDLLPLAGALGYLYVARKPEARPGLRWTYLFSALSILIGLFMAFAVISSITQFTPATTQIVPMSLRWGLLSFAWVALIRPPGKSDEGTQFARLLLTPLAVLQALHGFPVAGSQLYWATVLLIPVGALCIANGVRWIAVSRGARSARRVPRAIAAIGPIAAIVALVALVSIHINQGLNHVRAAYSGSFSLGLPGAKDVHVSAEEAANYQAVVAAIDKNCKSFVMRPPLSSFYFWTQLDPPAGYDPTDWSMLFDNARQQRVIEATRSIDGFCLLENAPLTHFWGDGAKIPSGPWYRYLDQGFVPIAKFGDYQLLKREGKWQPM